MTRILMTAAAALLIIVGLPGLAAAAPATPGYQFVLAGPPQSVSQGNRIVAIHLTHDGKPVTGAIIIQSRADMGPINMAAMTAPIKYLNEQPSGTYRFEITNGPVWKKPDNWAVSFGAKVQGIAQTVSGGVTVKLQP
jgi:hypothetical protein